MDWGGAVGLLSGLFGVGGGFLMTPLLIFIGVPPAVAVGTQAAQTVASSVSGMLAHMRRGNVDMMMGGVLTGGGFVGAGIGVALFNALKYAGHIDLTISLGYVIFFGRGRRLHAGGKPAGGFEPAPRRFSPRGARPGPSHVDARPAFQNAVSPLQTFCLGAVTARHWFPGGLAGGNDGCGAAAS